MTELSKQTAQVRADAIRVFQRELAMLEQEGVVALDVDQKQRVGKHHQDLLKRYTQSFDIDLGTQEKQLSLGMRIASFLGALALAASVFFLFYQFWGKFGATAQVGILLIASLATFVATMWLHGRESTGYFTKLAAVVAFACFVLNITMLGQIFNITPTDRALLAWAAYAFLLAYACDLRLLLMAGIVCVTFFIAAEAATLAGTYWRDWDNRLENFFPIAIALFFVPQWFRQERFSGFSSTYRVLGLLTLFVPMLSLAEWSWGTYLPLAHDTAEDFYQVAGFVVSGLVVGFGIRRHWPEVVNTAVVFFVVFLFAKFFDWWWEIMPKYLFFLVLGLTALLILFVLRRLRGAAVTLAGRGDA